MLHTTDERAIDSITAFATDLDYALDDAGNLAFEYNLSLAEVAKAIDANDGRDAA